MWFSSLKLRLSLFILWLFSYMHGLSSYMCGYLKRQCSLRIRKIQRKWIHGGPQNLFKLGYFGGTHDSVWTPKALASKWTHSGYNGEQRICDLFDLLKHIKLEIWIWGEILFQLTPFLDWNLVSMISFQPNQKNCPADPWGRIFMNN